MSEAKHTPLPWRIGKDEHGYARHYGQNAIYSIDNMMIAETIGGYTEHQADSELIVTSVNARPKVEELVDLVLSACRNPIMLGGEEVAVVSHGIMTKAREVEAALKGEA